MLDLNVIDKWRVQNNNTKNYTFYPDRHKSFPRIDFVFVSPSLIPYMAPIDILPILIFDHSPIMSKIQLSANTDKATRWRYNITLLTNPGFLTSLKAELMEFLVINRTECDNPQILWEITKCFIRGFCISFSFTLSKARNKHFNELEKQIKILENIQKQNFKDDKATQLSSLKGEYNALSLLKAEFIFHRMRQRYYFDAETPSRLLALRLKECESKASISAIKDNTGTVSTDPNYKHYDAPQCKAFPDGLNLPAISQTDKQVLDSPLELEELPTAL